MIEFTQYLRPDGRKSQQFIQLDDETEKKAERIIQAGYRFEMELLRDERTVSLTITGYDPRIEEENDVAHVLCENGPEVPESVKKLINSFKLL